MKIFKRLIVSLIVLFFVQSCGGRMIPDMPNPTFTSASFEVNTTGDTINRMYNGLKQGCWVQFEVAVVSNTIYSSYPPDTITYKTFTKDTKRYAAEEGVYIDDKKEGVWKSFFADGRVNATVTYIKDVAQ